MHLDTYMTIGEFSKIMKVSKHTLFHYDDIGLFSPEIIKENGYRYYSIDQMETLDTILLLKKSGMKLLEIKEFMEHRNPDSFLKIFDEKQQDIDQEIKRLQAMKKWMQQRKDKINYMKACDFSKIQIKYHKERYYLYEEINDNTSVKEYMLKINKLILDLEKQDQSKDYDVAYLQSPNEIEKGIYDGYHNTILLIKEKIENVHILPEGQYVTAYHKGHWESIGNTYKVLLKYIHDHHLETEGNYLEYYVVDNFMTKDIKDYVTEISIKIKDEKK